MRMLKYFEGKFRSIIKTITISIFPSTDFNEKAKRTVSDHHQAYQKFCRVVSPDHVEHLVEDDGEHKNTAPGLNQLYSATPRI